MLISQTSMLIMGYCLVFEKKCKILLSKNIYLTYPKKERPFQGWRYLESNDSPKDIKRFLFKENFEEEAIINELNSLGLL